MTMNTKAKTVYPYSAAVLSKNGKTAIITAARNRDDIRVTEVKVKKAFNGLILHESINHPNQSPKKWYITPLCSGKGFNVAHLFKRLYPDTTLTGIRERIKDLQSMGLPDFTDWTEEDTAKELPNWFGKLVWETKGN